MKSDLLKDECVICYENTVQKNTCGHTICDDCFQKCLRRWNPFKCPICRIVLVENVIDENEITEENTNDINIITAENPTIIQHFDSWLADRIVADTENISNMRRYLEPVRGFPFLFNFETCNHGIRVVSVKYPWIAKLLRFRKTWKTGDVIIYVNNESALTTNFGTFRNSRESKLCHVLDRDLFERFLTENI
jgi:hypothetical protein